MTENGMGEQRNGITGRRIRAFHNSCDVIPPRSSCDTRRWKKPLLGADLAVRTWGAVVLRPYMSFAAGMASSHRRERSGEEEEMICRASNIKYRMSVRFILLEWVG